MRWTERLGRNSIFWTPLALALSPLVAFAFLFALGQVEGDEDDDADRVPCPFCAESIKPEAIRCPFCRSEIPRSRLDRG